MLLSLATALAKAMAAIPCKVELMRLSMLQEQAQAFAHGYSCCMIISLTSTPHFDHSLFAISKLPPNLPFKFLYLLPCLAYEFLGHTP